MTTMWTELTALEDAAAAGSSAINAVVFMERAWLSRGPRRTAALLLSCLFGSVGVDAVQRLTLAERGALDVLLSGPLVAACVAVTTVLAMGARR